MSFAQDFFSEAPALNGARTSYADMALPMDEQWDFSLPLSSPASSFSPAADYSGTIVTPAVNKNKQAVEDGHFFELETIAYDNGQWLFDGVPHQTASPVPSPPVAASVGAVKNLPLYLEMDFEKMASVLELMSAERSGSIDPAALIIAPESYAPVYNVDEQVAAEMMRLNQPRWPGQPQQEIHYQPSYNHQPASIPQQQLPDFFPPSAAASSPASVTFTSAASAPASIFASASATIATASPSSSSSTAPAKIKRERRPNKKDGKKGQKKGHVQALKWHTWRCERAGDPLSEQGCKHHCLLRVHDPETWEIRSKERWQVPEGYPEAGQIFCGLWEHKFNGDMLRLKDGQPFRLRDRQPR